MKVDKSTSNRPLGSGPEATGPQVKLPSHQTSLKHQTESTVLKAIRFPTADTLNFKYNFKRFFTLYRESRSRVTLQMDKSDDRPRRMTQFSINENEEKIDGNVRVDDGQRKWTVNHIASASAG